ncbi:MAG TPA: GDP-L-fucose synthase [Candidatus Paceibacterota bacterium]
MEKSSRIYVAGHRGLVGSAIIRALQKNGYKSIITRTRRELDLLDQKRVATFFEKEKPEYIFLAAAKVGGIVANESMPADFIFENLEVQNNVISNAYIAGAKKLLFLGSSCIYPKFAKQPIKEKYLLSGELEETNRPYAIAKIAGLVMCESYNRQYGTNFISVMPTNLYGPNDNFDPRTSHVIPGMIRKFDDARNKRAKSVTLWGTGRPKREFLHVDDLAAACLFLMNNYNSGNIINIGSGKDLTIRELASIVQKVIGYKGKIVWDKSKPDGTPRKLLNVSKIQSLGWRCKIKLEKGIADTYKWYKKMQ